jgi:hypothetical protein
MCEIFLEQSLDVENVASLLAISDHCSAPRLKVACLSMIRFSWEEVRLSEAYLDFVHSAPEPLRWELDDYLAAKHVIQSGTVVSVSKSKGKGEARPPALSLAVPTAPASLPLLDAPLASAAAMLGGGSPLPLTYNTSWNRE